MPERLLLHYAQRDAGGDSMGTDSMQVSVRAVTVRRIARMISGGYLHRLYAPLPLTPPHHGARAKADRQW